MPGSKQSWLRPIAAKKIPGWANSRGVKKVLRFGMKQLQHPAVQQYATDMAGIGLASGGNPEIALPLMASRTIQEGGNVLLRTAKANW